jgi:hypothetical protein
MADADLLTCGEASLAAPCLPHQLRALADRKLIPFIRAGRYTLYRRTDLDLIRDELRKAGYIHQRQEAAAVPAVEAVGAAS